jgi:Uma2 family endonuclease
MKLKVSPARRIGQPWAGIVALADTICDDDGAFPSGGKVMSLMPEAAAIRLGPDWNGAQMTPEEFDAVEEYDEDYSYELAHGVLVVNPIPAEAEADPNEELGHWLRAYKKGHAQGSILDATLSERYVRTTDSRRKADRLIWAGLGRTPNARRDVPTVVVEFVSASRRDRQRDYVEKRRGYMEIGVSEYWIVDRFRRTMTVVLNQPDGPREQLAIESETYRTALLPGFELPLARLLAVADRWARQQ